jgi:alkylation response protein AidB-like acyl-CoA dehydrogenase
MSYNVDPKQQAVREEVRAFAEKEIYPVSEYWDRMPEPRQFPFDLYRKIGQAGFIGYAMPKEYGGSGKSHLEYITLVEELCYHDAAIGLLCAVAELATSPIINFGSEEQKKKYVPDCASGKRVVAFVLTEPQAGSDAANQQTVATENGDFYHVNGEKIFIMHGDVADLAVLFCKIEGKPKMSAMIVDTKQAGWDKRTLKNKMGMRAATTGGIYIKDVKVPKNEILGPRGRGRAGCRRSATGAR